jgi:hypothetical protein
MIMDYTSDTPIESAEEDVLGRAPLAETIAGHIQRVDASEGFVIGVLGPWGIGKTSLLNLIKQNLQGEIQAPAFQFNPWLFSESEQLVATFFGELGRQIRVDLNRTARLADALESYGESLSVLRHIPVAGPTIDKVLSGARGVGKLMKKSGRDGLLSKRDQLRLILGELDHPIVVLVDDVDRLADDEISDVFRLVRLTGNFPNLIYVVAFDRTRVESVFGGGEQGRRYIEKIVQLAFDMPAVPQAHLRPILFEGLDTVIANGPTTGLDEARWPDVFQECIWPLISTVRDVKRYLTSLPITLETVGTDVALVDVLALDAVRMFLPDVHDRLVVAAEALTTVQGSIGAQDHQAERYGEIITSLVEAAGASGQVVEDLIRRVFPAAVHLIGGSRHGVDWLDGWQSDRRVAHPTILRFYVDRVVTPEMLTIRRAELAFELLTDREAFSSMLQQLDPDDLESVITGLEAFERRYPAEAAIPASSVLLDLYGNLRTERRGVFDMGPEITISRVVLRLLQVLDDPARISEAVETVLLEVRTIFGAWELVRLVGHEENVGQGIVPEEDAVRFEREVIERIAEAEPDELSTEREILWMLMWAYDRDPQVRVLSTLTSPTVRRKLFLDALTTHHSQQIGSRALQTETVLYWEPLVAVLGSEEEVSRAIHDIEGDPTARDDLKTAIALAKKYLTGWRPDESRRLSTPSPPKPANDQVLSDD